MWVLGVLMKRIWWLSLFVILLVGPSVQALSWAYPFVVWEGKVYEVKQEQFIEGNDIGYKIGKVETQPDDMSGNYYGDASNYYPIGTNYYKINGTSTSDAIAVKSDNQWVKAVYVHKAPFHIMNVLTNVYFISAVVVLMLIVIGIPFLPVKTRNE